MIITANDRPASNLKNELQRMNWRMNVRMNSIQRQKLKKGSMEFCYGLKLQVCACGQWMRNARKVFYNVCSIDDTRKQGANVTPRHERPTKMNETTSISRAGYSSGRRSAIDAADGFFAWCAVLRTIREAPCEPPRYRKTYFRHNINLMNRTKYHLVRIWVLVRLHNFIVCLS